MPQCIGIIFYFLYLHKYVNRENRRAVVSRPFAALKRGGMVTRAVTARSW